MQPNFFIVGVGGSAGAVDALHRMFSAVPATPARCYVVVIHLSAEHETALHELLSTWSGLPASVATDGMPLQAGQIIVAPPSTYLEFEQGKLRVRAREHVAGRPDVIDRMFVSLAAEAGPRAVAIVLSGNGDDGAAGVEAVKRAGGRVLVQDPATCINDSMPRSVIRRRMVDATLAPESLAEAIELPLVEYETETADASQDDHLIMSGILDLVRVHSGNDLAGYKPTTLRRRVDRRAALQHCEGLAAYLSLLKEDAAELDRLAKDMFIGVTAFLRDPEAFKVLETSVVPELCEGKSGDGVRVWVAGCSTGEEVYSVAMLLRDWADTQQRTISPQIFATDIDEAALEVARTGRYRPEALANLPATWRERYFVETGEGMVIAKSIREMVVFAAHNLISDPPFSRLDLLVCRNVLIYLNPETQRKLLTLFHFVLRSGGFLFLGSSETIGSMAQHFEPVNKQWRIYRHLSSPASRRPPAMLVTGTLASRRTQGGVDVVADIGSLAGQERIYRRLIESAGPTQILVNGRMEVLYTVGDVAPYLEYPSGEPTRDLFKLLRHELRVPLRAVVTRSHREGIKIGAVTTWHRGAAKDADPVGLRLSAVPVPSEGEESLMLVELHPDPEVKTAFPPPRTEGEDWLLQQMEQELDATREDLQRTIERMRVSNEETKAANEEITAMNEELQSSNEELESSKEELQSLNEELATTNAALDGKVSELERANADLNNLLISTETATLFLDADLRIRRYTAACTQLMRVIPADIGRSLADIVQVTRDHDMIADCRRVLAGQAVPDQDIQSADGRWFMRRILPYRNADQVTVGVVLTFPEVTAIKASEAELARRNDELLWQAGLLREAPVIGADLDDRIIFWNEGAESLYGWSNEEALGKRAHELLKSEFPLSIDEMKSILRRDGEWRGRVVNVRRDGERVVVDSKWTLQRDREGRAAALVSVNLDVTAQVAAEELLARYRDHLEELVRERTAQAEDARLQAEQANRAKGEFLSHMSHELRTPLNVVFGYAQLLSDREGSALDPTRRQQTDGIRRAAEHLLHLVDDVLNLSLIDSGTLVISPTPIALADAVQNAVEAVQGSCRSQDITIVNEVTDRRWRVLGDPVRLQQVLLNLLSNAIKYNVRGGRVTLSASQARGEDGAEFVMLDVQDTGRGLSEEQLAHLFEPFNRLGAERSSIEGTGIGLTIARRLIEHMGGRIEVRSKPGQGSTFRLVLPADGPHAVEPQAKPRAASAEPGKDGRLRVLYVEDHPVNIEVMRAMVESHPKVELAVAASGTEALEAVRRSPVDLLLIDMHLGDMSGTDLVNRLRDFGLAGDMRFVAVSADALPAQIDAALAAGFHRYLTKPVRRELLFALIDDALAGRLTDASSRS